LSQNESRPGTATSVLSPRDFAAAKAAALEEKRAAVKAEALQNTQSAKQARAAAAKQAKKDQILSYQIAGKDIRTLIGAGDVQFLSVEWLLTRPDYWKVVRCNELAKEAFLAGEDAVWLYERLGGLVILSYPWLTKAHPDPQGFHFHTLALYLRVHQKHFMSLIKPPEECFKDVGVFWDFASLTQPKAGASERTAQEQQLFARGMKTVEYLYGSAMTIVVQLKLMPFAAFENMNRTPYENRGWCYFEEYLAGLRESSFQSLNLSLINDQLEERNCDWPLLASAAQNEKRPPLHPDALKQELITRVYSARDDCDVLLTKYTEFFSQLAGSTLEISLPLQAHIAGARPWGIKEVDYLVRALPAFTSCMKLNLRGRSLGDSGAEKLSKALPALARLETLWINNCDIGNKGITALAPALRELKNLIDLKLHGSRFTAVGLRELCDVTFWPFIESKEKASGYERAFLQLAKLEDLSLPLDLAKTSSAEVLNRLIRTDTVQFSRLMVKWM